MIDEGAFARFCRSRAAWIAGSRVVEALLPTALLPGGAIRLRACGAAGRAERTSRGAISARARLREAADGHRFGYDLADRTSPDPVSGNFSAVPAETAPQFIRQSVPPNGEEVARTMLSSHDDLLILTIVCRYYDASAGH
jgi:hypothetical protein